MRNRRKLISRSLQIWPKNKDLPLRLLMRLTNLLTSKPLPQELLKKPDNLPTIKQR